MASFESRLRRLEAGTATGFDETLGYLICCYEIKHGPQTIPAEVMSGLEQRAWELTEQGICYSLRQIIAEIQIKICRDRDNGQIHAPDYEVGASHWRQAVAGHCAVHWDGRSSRGGGV